MNKAIRDEHSELKWFSLDETRRLTNLVDSNYARFTKLGMGTSSVSSPIPGAESPA